jgi:hypothetical protein
MRAVFFAQKFTGQIGHRVISCAGNFVAMRFRHRTLHTCCASATKFDCARSPTIEFTCYFLVSGYGSSCALVRNTECSSVHPCKVARGSASHREQNQLGESHLTPPRPGEIRDNANQGRAWPESAFGQNKKWGKGWMVGAGTRLAIALGEDGDYKYQ